MRTSAPWRRMVGLPVAIVAVFFLVLQALVPAADALLPPGSICHVADDDGGRAPQPLPGHDHEHCLLCQSGAVASVLPPSTPHVPVPIVAAAASAPLPVVGPRGVARPAYASRAPPAIG